MKKYIFFEIICLLNKNIFFLFQVFAYEVNPNKILNINCKIRKTRKKSTKIKGYRNVFVKYKLLIVILSSMNKKYNKAKGYILQLCNF